MMSVLIFSLPGDAHALAVKWALENKGETVNFQCWSDFPQKLSASLSMDCEARPDGDIGDVAIDQVSVLWNHRTLKAVPPVEIDLADHQPISEGSDIFYRGLIQQIERRAFAVNRTLAKARADNKLTQLVIAKEVGFTVPRTLVSNDHSRISRFLREEGPCIVKPLRFMRWKGDDSIITSYTTGISDLEQFDPIAVTSCPMIYQQKIEKDHELRVVVFGDEVRAFKLHSQDRPESSDDWRAISYRGLRVSPIELDEGVKAKILSLLRMLGLVSGSLDFAVTRDGEFIFFEVNETGQFLWLEELAPTVPLLDMFASFLSSRNPHFRYLVSKRPVTMEEWLSQSKMQTAEDLERRVQTDFDKRYPDEVIAV